MLLADALQIAQIIISIALITLIVLQGKGAGGLGSLAGGDFSGGITKTRRGLEKTMFQITVGLSVAFLTTAIISVLVG